MMFTVLAGGVALCAIIATGSAVGALRQGRRASGMVWGVMAVFLLLWTANIVAKVAANPALLSNAPP